MGSLYLRGNIWWMAYEDAAGKRRVVSTERKQEEEAEAREILDRVERHAKAERKFGGGLEGPLTVRQYCDRWIKERKRNEVGSAENEERYLRRHVLRHVGSVPLADLRPHHVRDMVRALKRVKKAPRKKKDGSLKESPKHLAPRTIRHAYMMLHRVLHDAVVDELIVANPCVLKRGELPGKVDADPEWRVSAVFSRAEVERILGAEEIPEDRRVLYALLFLGGMRFGEAAALRWRDLDTTHAPLGRLVVAHSFSTQKHAVKTTKTARTRQVPVHPALKKILAAWELAGWQQMIEVAPVSIGPRTMTT